MVDVEQTSIRGTSTMNEEVMKQRIAEAEERRRRRYACEKAMKQEEDNSVEESNSNGS